MARSRKVGALWVKTSKDSKTTYLSGVVHAGIFGDIQISILKNTFKEDGSNQPDYNILLVEPILEQKDEPVFELKPVIAEVTAEVTPEEPNDDIPF
jgi:hypothetical protein